MSRRSVVLAALRAAGDVGLSGETLAADLGISRVAIAKHIAALENLGYEIDAAPGKGYRLRAAPDLPIPEEVAPLVRSPLWVRLEGGGETGSTNDDAKRLAREGAPEGTAVLAVRQTAGRGRLGRSWESPTGGVYVSAILRPTFGLAEISALPLAVSLAVAHAIESLGACAAGVKWPNDVYVGDGKIAGILLETSAEADRIDWLVVGIGLNVSRPAEDVAPGAVYLDDTAEASGLARAAAALLDELAEAYARFGAAGFAPMREEYERRSTLAGRDVIVSGPDGVVRAQGRVIGVDDQGRLVLDAASGRVVVSAGDVTLREPSR